MLTRFYLNGQTTHVLELCRTLQQKGHRVFLVISRLDHPGFAQWLRDRHIPFSRTDRPSSLVHRFSALGFDVIHNHSAHTLHDSLQLSRSLKIPVVATCHYLDFEPLEALGTADAVVAISEEMAAQLPLPPHKVRTVENGVPIPYNVNLSRRPQAAVILARATDSRRTAYARLTDILLEQGWRVAAAGGWRHPSAVTLGWTQNPQPLLERARLVVGTGRAIREGMACGCVGLVLGELLDGIVTPDNVEMLRWANFSGRAMKKEPTPENIRDELGKLSDWGVERLMRFSRAYAVEHFGISQMADALTAIYLEVIGRGKAGGSV